MYRKLIIAILVCFLILLSYKYHVTEPMEVMSDYMKKNVYRKYGIHADEIKKTLMYKGKKVNSAHNFNLPSSIKKSSCKITTSNILSQNGYPVCNYMSWNHKLNNEENIRLVNDKLEFPVVVKPSNGKKGKGVRTDIIDNKTLLEAINNLKKQNKNSIIIEEQASGKKYRIMILNDKFVYASENVKPIIIGDGVSSISQLIKQFPEKNNTKPIFVINEDLIQQQGYKLNSVLENNKSLNVTNVVNISNGGKNKYIDEDEIHPTNSNLFRQINNILGLNFSGIDYMSDDLSIPYFFGGKIIEVNGGPGLKHTLKKKPGTIDRWVNALFQ